MLIIALLVSIIFYFALNCFLLSTEIRRANASLRVQQADQKATFFVKLFINKVLLSTEPINFEDRLKLENAVRDIDDPEIFAQWQKFTASKDDAETQKIVGIILKLIIDRMSS